MLKEVIGPIIFPSLLHHIVEIGLSPVFIKRGSFSLRQGSFVWSSVRQDPRAPCRCWRCSVALCPL